ncbi:iron-siderophore ABC transporter substrate-binding protein [Antarcticirhabdus aurantiaca]|uniref:Iron-siderophore ABC transporter substrate-binding protein n=1 Tax=Antarcticirhabdus aurantiaca TaxID=2606717 RepID=A0ACD4NPG6_9HYPH|nr:iron-siderophore ABC transporter substrate-binding protein [Antarcticirhabdus aurantiaca]WAJ28749.1 iron-siderophore ABC transporter substrate-binding protein [Jeongeuplla avenae]
MKAHSFRRPARQSAAAVSLDDPQGRLASQQQFLEGFQSVGARQASRRAVLAGLAALLAAPVLPARAALPRIAVLDYALAETLIALGLPPVGLSNARGWSRWVVEPALPAGTVDLGIDLAVNREVLAGLKPDLILTTDYVAAQEDALSAIAPVKRLTIYDGSAPVLDKAKAVTLALGQAVGRAAEASRFVAETEADFADLKRRNVQANRRPVLVLSFMDARHVRVYGRPGLAAGVLDAIGIPNAWEPETNLWGFETVPVERLARAGEADILVLDPVPPDALPTLQRSPLWRELPAVKRGRLTILPPALMFGALPSARRFARLATEGPST